jgi:hypothetical protein
MTNPRLLLALMVCAWGTPAGLIAAEPVPPTATAPSAPPFVVPLDQWLPVEGITTTNPVVEAQRQVDENAEAEPPEGRTPERYLRSYQGPGGEIQAGFVPESTRILEGEPLFINFVVRNHGQEALAFMLGGDSRGSVRHNRFLIVARVGVYDSPLPDPYDYTHMGGLIQNVRLEPGQAYTQPLLLQHWVSLSGLGGRLGRRMVRPDGKAVQETEADVTVVAATTLEPLQPRPANGKERFPVPIASPFTITVVQGDAAAMAAVVERFATQAHGKDERERRKAWFALGYMKQPAALAVLLADLPRVARKPEPEWGPATSIADGDTNVIVNALRNYIDDPRVVPLLADLVVDRGNVGRAETCSLLGYCDHPRARAALLKVAEEDPNLRGDAVRGLGRLKEKAAVPLLRRMLGALPPMDYGRPAIADALCELGEPFESAWVMELVRAWPGGNNQTYSSAAGTLGRHGTLADARDLARLLRDDQPREISSFNAALIRAIQELGGPKHPYVWLDGGAQSTPERTERNRQSIEAYRAWAKQSQE